MKSFIERTQPEPTTGCLLWLGCTDKDGYGRVGVGRKNALAHRVAYEHEVGPIPEGMQLDHKCRTRCCVNPAHLEPVTQRENCDRGIAARTHCRNRHEFTPENTRLYRGERVCRRCDVLKARRARERKAVSP